MIFSRQDTLFETLGSFNNKSNPKDLNVNNIYELKFIEAKCLGKMKNIEPNPFRG